MDHADRPGLDIRLLGPVSVAVDGRDVAIGSPKQRVVLAMLALSRRVTVDAFADELWREKPPASVAATVQTLVSRLRRTFQDAGAEFVIHYEPGAYALDIDPGRVDVHRFHQEAAAGRAALEGGRPVVAAEHLRRALALWRGPALEEFSERNFARLASSRLDEARLAAGEGLAEAELATDHPAAALQVLHPLMAVDPFREQLWAHRMTALYRLAARPTRWPPTRSSGNCWPRSSDSTPARPSRTWSARSCGRARSWPSNPPASRAIWPPNCPLRARWPSSSPTSRPAQVAGKGAGRP